MRYNWSGDWSEQLHIRAYAVMGIPPWFRLPTDPAAQWGEDTAREFLKSIENRLPIPMITGGLINDPAVIIHLYWSQQMIRTKEGIWQVPLSITFDQNRTCSIRWLNTSGSFETRAGLQLSDLIEMDLARKFAYWNGPPRTNNPGFSPG